MSGRRSGKGVVKQRMAATSTRTPSLHGKALIKSGSAWVGTVDRCCDSAAARRDRARAETVGAYRLLASSAAILQLVLP